jgi:hypothetical protein
LGNNFRKTKEEAPAPAFSITESGVAIFENSIQHSKLDAIPFGSPF